MNQKLATGLKMMSHVVVDKLEQFIDTKLKVIIQKEVDQIMVKKNAVPSKVKVASGYTRLATATKR